MSISGLGNGFASYAAMGMNRIRGGQAAEESSDVATVRKDGLTAFAKQAKKDAWTEKLKRWRDEAMKAMGLTDDKLAAMSPEARAKALQQVDELVQRKIKDAMEAAREEGKRKGAEGGQMNVPQFVDFSV